MYPVIQLLRTRQCFPNNHVPGTTEVCKTPVWGVSGAVSKVPRAVGRFGRPPVGRPSQRPAAPRSRAEAPVHCAALGSLGECAFGAHCAAPPGPAMCTEFRPCLGVARTLTQACLPQPLPPALCSLGIPASKRRKSSAQRPALRCRARSSADPEQRLSSASTPPAACPQFSV